MKPKLPIYTVRPPSRERLLQLFLLFLIGFFVVQVSFSTSKNCISRYSQKFVRFAISDESETNVSLQPTIFIRKNGEDPPHIGYFSIKMNAARLANNIFELVSMFGLSKYLNRKPIIYLQEHKFVEIVEKMRKLMPELMDKFDYRRKEDYFNVPLINFNKKCCAFDNPEKLKSYKENHIHLNGTFFQSYKYFDSYREEVRNFVKPEENFGNLPLSSTDNFIACIHSRRTDFVDGEHHPTDKDFIISARNLIREKENRTNMITVLIGDDPKFERTIFPDESNVFVSSGSPIDDLIYARYNCDAALITAPSSTFGWWISYLSKGERVYYLDIKTTNDVNYMKGELVPEDFFDSRWTALKFDNSTKVASLSS